MKIILAIVLASVTAFVISDVWYVVSRIDQFLPRDIVRHASFDLFAFCIVVFNLKFVFFNRHLSKNEHIKLFGALLCEVFIVGILVESVLPVWWTFGELERSPSSSYLLSCGFYLLYFSILLGVLFGLLRWSWRIKNREIIKT